ncbi:hypothetical protein KM043_017131 [Ampulex compressa]|nr:hypothetical protein KM043_017131 [Ampulex compressa]
MILQGKDVKRNKVYLAIAMQNLEEFQLQAILPLEKAIKIQPDNPVAWRGITAYYKKNSEDNDNWKKLVQGYCKLMQLDSTSSKFSHMLDTVCELCLRHKDDKVLAEAIEILNKMRDTSDIDKVSLINKTLAWLLTEYSVDMSQHQEVLESILMSVIQDVNIVNRQDYYRRYLKILYDTDKIAALIQNAIEMHEQFPQDIHPLEWICRGYYKQNIIFGNCMEIDITTFYNNLLKIDMNSEYALLAKAIHLKCSNDLIKSRDCVNEIIVHKPFSFNAWILLSELYTKLYCWEDAENSARKALQLKKAKEYFLFKEKLLLIFLDSMSRSNSKEKWQYAKQMCEELLTKEHSIQLRTVHTRTRLLLDDADVYDELNDMELKEETKVQANIMRALHLKRCKRYEEAANVLDSALEISEAWLLLGEIYLEMRDYNHSLMAFLNGIKSDRYNWQCLVYIGDYYREHGNDIEKARRCYQTALQINPNSEHAGIGLSTTYRLLKNEDANMQLLQKLTMQESGPKWAWLQLGLQYLDQEDNEQAIQALQRVIRSDPNDSHSWESLADAYLMRGAHTSALKSYQRALKLCPDSLYPLIQLANIKVILGQYEEAKIDFELILSNEPRYVPALKGLAEMCLGLARINLGEQLLGQARDNLQQAIDCLTEAIMERNDLSCIWKLLGDVCYKASTMSKKYSHLKVSSILMKSDSADEYITITGFEISSLSIRCYCRALSLSQDYSFLWHDLACCYLMQLQHYSPTDSISIANKGLAAAKYAVQLCPTSWRNWNILGVICMLPQIKNYALAQHSYIMVIDKEPNNATAWSNLGTLYLHLGNLYKANEAYSRAQRADPGYLNSWIGQGLIAEMTRRNEAMELLKHATQLGYHNQAALGYAHWVLTMLLDPNTKNDRLSTYIIKNMHAIQLATDMLNWYTEHSPNNVYARNVYGLLLERQKLYKSAAEQFAAGLDICSANERTLLSINLSRVLIQLKKYDEAIALCRAIKKITFNSQCHLALALFKAEKYEESYATYETALQWLANTEAEKANTLCAMAAMAYMFQEIHDVKTLLFQCIQIKPPTIVGFLAVASLGILHGDLNLTKLVLNELKSFEDHPEYGHHVVSLSAYSHLIQNNITNAVRILSKGIYKHPHDVRYWIPLIRTLLEVDVETFKKCTKKISYLSRSASKTNIVHVACTPIFEPFTQRLTSDHIRSAQKTLFLYPGKVESWANFVAMILPRCADKNCKTNAEWLTALISVVQTSFQATPQMAQWLKNNQQQANSYK